MIKNSKFVSYSIIKNSVLIDHMYYDDKVSRGNILSRDLKFLVISESERCSSINTHWFDMNLSAPHLLH